MDVTDKIVDSGMDVDSEYLCTIHDKKDSLMYYHCEINKVQGTALADTGVMGTYISHKYAEKANL